MVTTDCTTIASGFAFAAGKYLFDLCAVFGSMIIICAVCSVWVLLTSKGRR